MNLSKKDDSQRPFEYACNEGNYGMVGILNAARAEEKAGLAVVSPRDAEGER
jgi:ribosome biogenesis protein Tsr3